MSEAKDVKMETNVYDEDEELKNSLEKLTLPSNEEHAQEKSTGFGQEASCFINTFKLDLSRAPSTIFQYELRFTITKSNGEELTLHDALAHLPEAARSKKRKALICLSRAVHEHYQEVFRKQQMGDPERIYWRHCCAFDCGCFYYTGVRLDDADGEIPEIEWRESGDIVNWARAARGAIKWSLTYVKEFPIQGEEKKSPEALMFFTTLAQQVVIRSEKIDMKPDAAYLVDGEPTKENKELRKGICLAAKVMGDDVVIQMDSKIALFFQSMALFEFIKRSAPPGNDLRRFLFDKVASRKLNKELKNLPLITRHLKQNRTFECKGFSESDANGTKFTMKGRDEPISVAEYYLEVYKHRLIHPNLPLVREKRGKGGGDSFYPIECLDICDGIRVSNQKMTREAQENMISKSCRAPAQLGRDLEMSRGVSGLDGTSKYIKAFGIKLSQDFNVVNGKILWKPHVAGMAGMHPDINDRGQISYIKNGFKFADPAKPSRPITLIALGNALGGRECDQLKEELRRMATDLGMKIDFSNIRDPCLYGGSIEQLREFMNAEKRNTSMFFFVTKEKMDESHNMVKKVEQEIGVVTQCVSLRTANDCLSKKRVTQYNVVAKMNQKLGGVVVNPEVPPDLKNTNPDAFAKAADWFKDRMFVGFTLSHAGAQSFADRVVGEEVREPTCVGMGFTLKQPGKRSAMSWFQKKRHALILDIKRHMVRALDIYAESNNGKHPSAILIFRKGMSEGELKKAAKEMDEVMEAIKEISARPRMENWRPTVQCLVCMGNTPDRMFYNRGGDANVPAGTCVVEGATHPNRVEFLIVPHNAIKGTAKGVRCTLVADKRGKQGRQLEVAELQMLYHTMCYINGVAASPTRLPVPLSDSEKAAERQMNIFKESIRNGDDTMSMASGRSTGGVINDGTERFFENLSDNFAHKFKDIQYLA